MLAEQTKLRLKLGGLAREICVNDLVWEGLRREMARQSVLERKVEG